MSLFARNLLWAGPAACAYGLLIPLGARTLDRHLSLELDVPWWLASLGGVLLACGAAVALWSVCLLAVLGGGTPNPIAPPVRLVVRGPYRVSRNPMMVGGWVAGLGLAALLGSPSLAGAVLVIILAGVVYVRMWEEPRLERRFGPAYQGYLRSAPRWLGLMRQ